MSTSTVSITANPTTRRRPVLASVKNTNIELVTTETNVAPANGVGDDKVTTGNTKDLSHQSVRGEAVQVKKTIPNSTVLPRRNRKVPVKPEKPRWTTILRVLTKNFILLIALLGLVQLIKRLALKPEGGEVRTYLGLSQFEGQIAELEKFLKTTTKMMQVQVEFVDRKIENEIGGLRNEVNKVIEDKTTVLESGFKRLEAKSEGLERSLGELKAVDWLSMQEFEKIYEELKKAKNGELGDGVSSLSDIRVYAREMIEKEIEKHAADGLGRVDYALASGGAMVVRHSEPYLVRRGSNNWFLRSARNGVHVDAGKILKPSFGEPGQCFALKGSSGFVQIRLRTAIIPDAITLEHVAKSIAYDSSSAPKDCRVSGWLHGQDSELTVNNEKMFLLTEFTYDLEKSNAQTFNVVDTDGSNGVVDTVRIDFSSNHGSPSHTCIYRLRVHGQEPDAVSVLTMQS